MLPSNQNKYFMPPSALDHVTNSMPESEPETRDMRLTELKKILAPQELNTPRMTHFSLFTFFIRPPLLQTTLVEKPCPRDLSNEKRVADNIDKEILFGNKINSHNPGPES